MNSNISTAVSTAGTAEPKLESSDIAIGIPEKVRESITTDAGETIIEQHLNLLKFRKIDPKCDFITAEFIVPLDGINMPGRVSIRHETDTKRDREYTLVDVELRGRWDEEIHKGEYWDLQADSRRSSYWTNNKFSVNFNPDEVGSAAVLIQIKGSGYNAAGTMLVFRDGATLADNVSFTRNSEYAKLGKFSEEERDKYKFVR